MNFLKSLFHTGIFLLLALLCGCGLTDSSRSRLWLFNSGSGVPTSEEDSLLSPASFLEFRPDGTYTSDFGRFNYGSWNLKDQKLYLTNQRRTTYVYRVKNMDKKELQLVMAKGEIAHFDGYSLPSSKPESDPFSTYNNQWRITSAHKEDDTAIRKRLFNHCRFWETLFSWASDKNLALDVRQTPTPLKIYANGFGLKHYDDLPEEWKSYFFDEGDCRKADTLIIHTFRQTKIVWPKTEDDYKRFISGFQQLEKALR
jgi:hypothetical protein